MKNHALRSIALISLMLILLTDVILTVTMSFYSLRLVTDSCEEKASDFRSAFTDIIPYYISDNPDESDIVYKTFKEYLRSMFAFSEAKYVYLFHASHEDDCIEYEWIIAADEEDNQAVSEKRSRGTRVPIGERKFIDKALDGALSGPEKMSNEFGTVWMYYFPVYDEDGRLFGIAGIDFDITLIKNQTTNYVVRIVLIVTVVLAAVLGMLLLVLRRRVFHPIKKLSMQMNSFDPENAQPGLKLNSYQEIEEINSSFDKMSADIIGYIRNLRSMTEERSRAAAELSIARSIQVGMVPEHLTLSGAGYEICAYASPAKAVGGDFYDCFEQEGKVCIVIADVSGKGIAAAMFMAMAKNMIRERLRLGCSPADALNSANDEICAENPEGMFVTVFAAVLNLCTGELRYANAGHTRPLLICGREKQYLDPDPGIVLGLFEDAGLENECRILESGSILTIYTDGVTEALNGERELFGEKRLLDAAQAGSAGQTAESVIDAVKEYSADCEQSDDITLVSAQFTACDGYVDEYLPPQTDSLGVMHSRLFDIAGKCSKTRSIVLACEEILVNIISYSGTDTIRMTMGLRENTLTVRFEDGGKAFDPFQELPAEKEFGDYDSGGLGIRMVTQIAEKASYIRISEKNIVTMRFAVGEAKQEK